MEPKFFEEKKEISLFCKVGIVVLSSLVLCALGFYYIPHAITTSTQSNRELPIYCVNTTEPKIALSFDAAWGNEQTQAILDVCEKYGIKVTFFMTGGWVDKYPESVKAIATAGHELGNHSQNHKQMSKLSEAECEEEILSVQQKVYDLTGITMQVFRPPYGDYDNELIQAVRACGCYPIQWDVDSLDWKDYGAQSIISTICDNPHLGNGSIILCHNGATYILDALDTVIQTLQSKGYQFVKMSDLIYKENYYIDHEGRQFLNEK